MELQDLLYAESNLGTTAQYIPPTTSPPPAIFCPPYQVRFMSAFPRILGVVEPVSVVLYL
jgi:hypothetical protein